LDLYSGLRKGCIFCHPLQLLLNWGISSVRGGGAKGAVIAPA